jgi:hypothetical protein
MGSSNVRVANIGFWGRRFGVNTGSPNRRLLHLADLGRSGAAPVHGAAKHRTIGAKQLTTEGPRCRIFR